MLCVVGTPMLVVGREEERAAAAVERQPAAGPTRRRGHDSRDGDQGHPYQRFQAAHTQTNSTMLKR